MNDASLSSFLHTYPLEQKNIKILVSSKSYDVNEFLKGGESNPAALSIQKVYYGKAPEVIKEHDIKDKSRLKDQILYCPVGIVFDTAKLSEAGKISEIYPFDPDVLKIENLRSPAYRLKYDEISRYVQIFFGSNIKYMDEEAQQIDDFLTCIITLNELHNPDRCGGFTEDTFEPKQITITLYIKNFGNFLEVIKDFPEFIKLIILPEKALEKLLKKPTIAGILKKIPTKTYRTKQYQAPSTYNRDIDLILREYMEAIERE